MSTVPSRFARARVRQVAPTPAVAGFRPGAIALAAAFALAGAHAQQSDPAGAVHGTATFARNGNNLLVTTTNGAGNRSVINWNTFGVAAGSTTRFQQPDAASTSINRVTGNTRSDIFGTLSSNGKLVLVNPSGIAIGANAMVDTGGFTASTMNLSEADAIAGRMLFQGGSSTLSVGEGARILAHGGDIVLVGSQVQLERNAVVQSDGGVIVAAGEKVEITGRGLEGIRLEVQTGNTAVNLGTLKGDAVGIFAGTLKHSGMVQAQAVSAGGGKVVLQALAGDNIVDGGVVASAAGGKGGSIDVLGNRVALLAKANIDASGANGGGSVRIGGDYQGKNPDVQNAKAVYVDAAAKIKADATLRGDGGRVIVWADEVTRMHGRISARGGVQGGNGGFAEVSGKNWLEYTGLADLRAPRGEIGTLLLDPQDVTIVASTGGSSGTGATPESPPYASTELGKKFEPNTSVGPVILSDSDLNTQLATAHVIVKTDSTVAAGSVGGQITVAAGADVNWSAGTDLKLEADKGITILGKIRGTGATSGLVLEAKNGSITDGGGAGYIEIPQLYAQATNGSVSLAGDHRVGTIAGQTSGVGTSFTFHSLDAYSVGTVATAWGGGTGVTSGSVSLVSASDLSIDAAVTSGAAGTGVSIEAGRYLNVNDAIKSQGGPVVLKGGTVDSEGAISIGATGSVSSSDGDIQIESLLSDVGGNSLTVAGVVDAGTGAISVTAQRLDVVGDGVLRRRGPGDIDVLVDGLSLTGANGDALVSNGGRVVINPLTTRDVAIIGTDGLDLDGPFNLHVGDLNKVAAQTLVVGNSLAPTISLHGTIDLLPGAAQELSLIAGSNIIQVDGVLKARAVNLDAASVRVNDSGNQVGVVSGRYDSEFLFRSDTALAIGTVDNIAGVQMRSSTDLAPTANLNITSQQALSINQDVTGVQVTLSGGSVQGANDATVHAMTSAASLVIDASGNGPNDLGGVNLVSDSELQVNAYGLVTLGNIQTVRLDLYGGSIGPATTYRQQAGTMIQASQLEVQLDSAAGSLVDLTNAGNQIGGVQGFIDGDLRVTSAGDMRIGTIDAGNVKLQAANFSADSESGIDARGNVDLQGTSPAESRLDLSATWVNAGGSVSLSNARDAILSGLSANTLTANLSGSLTQDTESGGSITTPGGVTASVGGSIDLSGTGNALGYVNGSAAGNIAMYGVTGVAAAGLTAGGSIQLTARPEVLSLVATAPGNLDLIGNVTATGSVTLASGNEIVVQDTSTVSGSSLVMDAPLTSVYGRLLPGDAGGIGSASATGDLAVRSGGTIEMDVASLSSFDTLAVEGVATTDAASSLQVKDLTGGTLSGSFTPTALGSGSSLAFSLPQNWTVSASQPYVITAGAAPAPSPAPAPAPAPSPGPSPSPAPGAEQVDAEQQANNNVVTFADLFVKMSQDQEPKRIGKDDIVVTDTACTR